ncbi:MAG: translation initiation factor eIF-1A [Candidatus Nanoarchaeia archaeon]|nr:translation initiation factor eIF-1A [Candidatus Nanoarchaeia archaeon]
MSKKKEEFARQEQIQEEIRRVKLPRDKQCIGVVDQRLGGSRMRVRCFDGKNRICRIPGRMKRRLWVREGDYVLVEPWELGGDEKADILFKYKPNQVSFLKKRGYVKEMEALEEF